jgi:hypothetical protein
MRYRFYKSFIIFWSQTENKPYSNIHKVKKKKDLLKKCNLKFTRIQPQYKSQFLISMVKKLIYWSDTFSSYMSMIYLYPFIWLMNNIVFSHITARNYIFIDRLEKSFGNVWLFDIVMKNAPMTYNFNYSYKALKKYFSLHPHFISK